MGPDRGHQNAVEGATVSEEAIVRDKVQRILVDNELDARLIDGGFQVPYESTAVNIQVIDQEDRVLIRLEAPLLRELASSPELFEWIATEGQDYFFGSCQYVPIEGDLAPGLLLFHHTLLGDYLDSEELFGALAGIATAGADLDDELQAKFGGKRFMDD
jgi:hypothetical protein